MNSIFFIVASRVLMPIMLVLSVVVLLRGHNEPGGGFIGGLLAAAAFAMHALAVGLEDARRRIVMHPRSIAAVGLLIAASSGMVAWASGAPFLTSQWWSVAVPGFESEIKIGTPVVFDIGVYLAVVGVTLLMIFTLEERQG